jgi:hypothetical protein
MMNPTEQLSNLPINYQEQYNSNDRQSPANSTVSSEGLGSTLSSASSSPRPSFSTSPPLLNKITYSSTPYHHNYSNSIQNSNQHTFNYNSPSTNVYYADNQINTNYYNTSSNFNDSNYYSRNNSAVDSTNHYLPCPLKNIIKPKLSFSIDAILSNTKSVCLKPTVENSIDDTKKDSKKTKRSKNETKSQNNRNSNTNKRLRTIFTQYQLDKLEEEFLRQQYMVGSERSYLATSLGLTESQVKIWFQNRRIKWRKTPLNGQHDNSNNEYEDDVNDYEENISNGSINNDE